MEVQPLLVPSVGHRQHAGLAVDDEPDVGDVGLVERGSIDRPGHLALAVGDLVRVRITGSDEYDLWGERILR